MIVPNYKWNCSKCKYNFHFFAKYLVQDLSRWERKYLAILNYNMAIFIDPKFIGVYLTKRNYI